MGQSALDGLHELSRIANAPRSAAADLQRACEVVRALLRAEEAYVLRAGDPYFIRLGCECDPKAYEIKQKGYWLIWRDAATHPESAAGMFNVSERLVGAVTPLRPGKPSTHIGAILPGDESNSEVLVVRGPWPRGLTAAQTRVIEMLRPALAHVVSSVLDAERRTRQREQLEALANISRAFNEARETDNVLTALATALAKASGFDWVNIVTYTDACDAIADRAMNLARHSSMETAAVFREGRGMQGSQEVRMGIELARNKSQVLIPDVFAPDLRDRPGVLIGDALPFLRPYWERGHILSVGMFPIVFQDRALGIVHFSSSTQRAFDAAEVDFLAALVAQAATAIRGLRLYEDLQQSREDLRQSEERFRSLVQNASDLVTVIEPDTTVTYQSPSILGAVGYKADEMTGTKLSALVHPDDLPRLLVTLDDVMTKQDSVLRVEARIRHRDGSWRQFEFSCADQRSHPAIGGLVLNTRDVTERKLLEEQLRHQALHDPLTQLANRTRFTDRLEHALLRASRTGHSVAVLFMDLDNFKSVNDSLGHSAGDRLLTEVAERVQASLRPFDTIARLGGDEFAILIEDVTAVGDAIAVARRIFETLLAPFDLDGKELFVRASIGIALSEDGGRDAGAEGLLRDADVAMYAAKSHGKARFEVFEPEMQASMIERLALMSDLQRAVSRDEFIVQYQPMVALKTGRLIGVEALVRWRHPVRGVLPPGDFIALAEESGVIVELGRWVLLQACRQTTQWQAAYPGDPPWTISVNVSVKQLQHPAFVAQVADILRETNIDPRTLVLEITESVMMQDVDATMNLLRQLKDLGVRLAIDDFGTGYSSLSYLRQFPFDLLKIDKSFIDDVGVIAHHKELTRAIIELGKTLDLELVAEGIERRDQLARLQTLDCELGQGFLFARPLDSDAVEALLRDAVRGSEAA